MNRPIVFMRRRQKGGAAVEFAFVFPFMFLFMYGVLVYSYLFVIQSSINFAAQEAAAAGVSADPTVAGHEALVRAKAREMASRVLGWMPENQRSRVLGGGGEKVEVSVGETAVAPVTQTIEVTLKFDVEGLFPTLNLIFVGEVPKMPKTIQASAVVRI